MVVAIGDIYQVQVEFRRDVESASIVRHYECTDVTDTDEETVGEALVGTIEDLWESSYIPLMGNNAALICVTARRLPPAQTTRTYVTFSGTAGQGTGLQPSRGAQQALLVSLYPDSGGDPKQGRNYVPFLAGELTKTGQIIAIGLTSIETAMTALLVTKVVLTSVAEFNPALAKKVLLNWISEIITARVVRPVLATQRRRVVHHQTTTT